MMTERIHSIMTKNVLTLSPNHTAADVNEIVKSKRYHHIPIVEGSKMVGIVTSYDLMRMDVPVAKYADHRIKDFMTTHVAYLNPNDQIGAAAELFMKHLFHGLPICDDDLNLVGIITTHDVLKYTYYKEYPREVPQQAVHSN